MREFFEIINEYPLTTFLVFIMIILLLEAIKECIHGDPQIIEENNENKIKDKKKNSCKQ